jgi:hypothetical protein
MISERDRYILEYRELRRQMRGINPKLSLHKTLSDKAVKLLEKIGGQRDVVYYNRKPLDEILTKTK